ncbi:unnamed protein product [Rodentolepis nana]|uniref:Cystatin domain-containing protein n=1 Tax=Rodentolepis nana TaxID=102285 RepID=A0A0R3TR54_RODNA|nr:unnamed protein product [Rodentolepis nana]
MVEMRTEADSGGGGGGGDKKPAEAIFKSTELHSTMGPQAQWIYIVQVNHQYDDTLSEEMSCKYKVAPLWETGGQMWFK